MVTQKRSSKENKENAAANLFRRSLRATTSRATTTTSTMMMMMIMLTTTMIPSYCHGFSISSSSIISRSNTERQHQKRILRQQHNSRTLYGMSDSTIMEGFENDNDTGYDSRVFQQEGSSYCNRRNALVMGASGLFLPSLVHAEETSSETPPLASSTVEGTTTIYKLPSGLRYVELTEGDGPMPQYGQIVSCGYTGYIKLPKTLKNPDPKPQQFDSEKYFVWKHGSGRTLSGIDEGIHTMKLHGKRRLLIPPKLGFIDTGLGPIPSSPYGRYRLNNLLDQMTAAKSGTIIYEIELKVVLDDEADQGYYTDSSPTQEELDKLTEAMNAAGMI